MKMDAIAEKMRVIEWSYGDKDPAALAILKERIAEAGRNLKLITYGDLVRGVEFHLSNIRSGETYQIRVYDWSGLDRAIIGDFLGRVSTDSYLEAGFMASALVVNKDECKPSRHFFDWMHSLDVLPNLNENTVLAFWADQVNKAHKWYSSRRGTPKTAAK